MCRPGSNFWVRAFEQRHESGPSREHMHMMRADRELLELEALGAEVKVALVAPVRLLHILWRREEKSQRPVSTCRQRTCAWCLTCWQKSHMRTSMGEPGAATGRLRCRDRRKGDRMRSTRTSTAKGYPPRRAGAGAAATAVLCCPWRSRPS